MRFLLSVFLTGLILVSAAEAQQNVVVVDMGKIFEKHVQFTNGMNGLQLEVKTFKESILADREKVRLETEKLAGVDRKSAEFKDKQASLAKMT